MNAELGTISCQSIFVAFLLCNGEKLVFARLQIKMYGKVMAAKDALGNIQSAACSVKVDFVTDDQTVVMPEEIRADQDALTFALTLTKSGSRYNPVLSWEGADAQKITAELVPAAALKGNGDGNFVLEWRSRSGAVKAELPVK